MPLLYEVDHSTEVSPVHAADGCDGCTDPEAAIHCQAAGRYPREQVSAEAVLARYSWPGNVRELQNVLGHACMMTDGDVIDVADLPEHLHNLPPRIDSERVELVPMSVVERRHAAGVLAALSGNKVQAARVLGIHRTTLARLLQEGGSTAEEDAGTVAPTHHTV